MNNDDRDLEALLRQALREQADRVQPAGDGLVRIRERAAQRRRRMAWLRPGIAAVAAALAVLAAVGIPALLNRSGPTGQDAASQATASRSTTAPRSTAPSESPRAKTAPPPPSATQQPSPTAGSTPGVSPPTVGQSQVQDVPMWPYSDSTDASASASTNQELIDPEALAVKFVDAFVSVDAPITPEPAIENGKTATVQVVRKDLGQRLVCTVVLQRVSPKSRAYVVTAAQTDRLTMKPASPIKGSTSVTVAGTVTPDPSATANTVYSAVLLPDGSTSAKRLAAQPTELSAQNHSWSVTVNTPERVVQPGIVAAWTVDLNGNVLDFTAQPAR